MTMTVEKMMQKVNKVQDVRDAVEAFLDEIEANKAMLNQASIEVEETLANLQESFKTTTDLNEAKKLKQKITDAEEELALVKQVSEAKVNVMYEKLADKAEEFFTVHKDAVADFKTLDKYMIANTGLGALKANKEIMSGFADALNMSFAGVKHILIDTGIVAVSEQNGRFKGTHLGQRALVTELVNFEYKVSRYIYDLKSAGLM